MSLYIDLYHGRRTPEEDMDDWGPVGPVFGPFSTIHTTYMSHIRGIAPNGDDQAWLSIVDDCVYYNGMFYGDWTVFEVASLEDMNEVDRVRVIPFNEADAKFPGKTEDDAQRDREPAEADSAGDLRDQSRSPAQRAAEAVPSGQVPGCRRDGSRGSVVQTLEPALL